MLAIVEDVHAVEIGMNAMACALTLADWYVAEAVRLQRAARTDARLIRAKGLLDWLQGRGEPVIAFRDVLQLGPSATRSKAAADEALKILTDHGWIEEASARPRQIRLLGRR